jgi:drug/metabolite transporter (DMT)-like permease
MDLFSKPVKPKLDPVSSIKMMLEACHCGSSMNPMLSRRAALLLFSLAIATWGLNWTVTKTLVHSVSPLWTTAIRSAIATVALFVLLLARRHLILPRRGDVPVIVSVSLLHMGAFSALVAFGIQFVPVGRSIVLGYSTPLWVAPAAWLFLREPLSRSRLAGIGLGLAGLATMFNPLAFDWSDRNAVIGNGLILLAAVCWAANILYVRAHKWISSPFQLVFWQALLATSVLSTLALSIDGIPRIAWSPALAGTFLYAGCGTALAHWAMVMVNRSLPAVTTSLGLLATPVVGVATSAICLGEPIGVSLILAMAMITAGIAIGTVSFGEGSGNASVRFHPRATGTVPRSDPPVFPSRTNTPPPSRSGRR